LVVLRYPATWMVGLLTALLLLTLLTKYVSLL